MKQEIKDLSIIKKEHIEPALLKYKELENKNELNLNRKSKNFFFIV